MDFTKEQVNTYALFYMGFNKIKHYSRYMINGSDLISISRMKIMKLRKDGRYNLINDRGARHLISPKALRGR